jgi:hypothetical protein
MMGADSAERYCLILKFEIVNEVGCSEGMVVGMIALDCHSAKLGKLFKAVLSNKSFTDGQ